MNNTAPNGENVTSSTVKLFNPKPGTSPAECVNCGEVESAHGKVGVFAVYCPTKKVVVKKAVAVYARHLKLAIPKGVPAMRPDVPKHDPAYCDTYRPRGSVCNQPHAASDALGMKAHPIRNAADFAARVAAADPFDPTLTRHTDRSAT